MRFSVAPLALVLFLLAASTAAARPFAMIGGDTICVGNLPDVGNLDCTYVADDAGWSPELAWCPEPAPVNSRLVAIEWKTADVAVTDLEGPGADHDDHFIGSLGEAFVMKVAQAACDAAGIVYFTTIDGELWSFNPDGCGDGRCNPTFIDVVEISPGVRINTVGGDIAFEDTGRLFMVGDVEGAGSAFYILGLNGFWRVLIEDATDVQAWGLTIDRQTGDVAYANDDHAYRLTFDGPVDLGQIGHYFEEYGGAANDPRFACSLEVEVEPDSPRRAMLGPVPAPLTARVFVRHVKTETVETTVRAWIVNQNGARRALFSESVELAYLGEFERRITLPALPAGTYTLVATVTRMNQGTVREETRFEVR